MRVLDGISFTMGEGESLAIMGPSGSGKTTLLNIIGTLDSPSAGRVLLDAADIHRLSPDEAARARNEKIGFVFQDHHLLPQCTAIENVLLPCLAFRRVGETEVGRVEKLLDRMGLAERRDHFPAELSGGERQRVAIARAMVNRPRLLLCDEPTGNLDVKLTDEIGRAFLQLCSEEKVALIVVTHNAEFGRMFGARRRLGEGKLHE